VIIEPAKHRPKTLPLEKLKLKPLLNAAETAQVKRTAARESSSAI
jgi:hypothetical protein